MGLDASVMCNCYREGKAKPCPFPEHFYVDEEGFPALNLRHEYNEDKFEAFDEWLATCCDHPDMDFAAVFIANWKGYRSFLQALEQLGWDRFPTLHAELPAARHRFLDEFAVDPTVTRRGVRVVEPVVDAVTESVARVLRIAGDAELPDFRAPFAAQNAIEILAEPNPRRLMHQHASLHERE